MTEKIKYWWSEDRQWFCILANDGTAQTTVSLTVEEAEALMDEVMQTPKFLAFQKEAADRAVQMVREETKAKVSDCISGECDCSRSEDCNFRRCKNCDHQIDADGKTLVDHGCEEEKQQVCPDCGGPLNDNLIYGALIA